jgi:hypothetical protein
MDVEPAFKFIDRFGSTLERYRAEYLFKSGRDDEVPLRYLRRLQNEDGGFPYNLEAGKPSSVNETSGMLSLVAELDLGESGVGQKAVNYLFRIQRSDGGWDENPDISQFSPPRWDAPNSLNTRMWLTGDVTVHLVQLGYAETQHVKRAREFLLNHMDEKGKVEGPRIATWIAMAIFGILEGRESPHVRKASDLVEGWLDEEPVEDASFLCWYLECLSCAEAPQEDVLVRKCLKKLMLMQDKDGGWKSADGARYNVSTTINALKLLRQYGEW